MLAETFFTQSVLYGADSARGAARNVAASREILIISTLEIATAALDRLASYERSIKKSKDRPSFFDCASFEVMRRVGIRRVFTFDRHFRDAGFVLIPASEA